MRSPLIEFSGEVYQRPSIAVGDAVATLKESAPTKLEKNLYDRIENLTPSILLRDKHRR